MNTLLKQWHISISRTIKIGEKETGSATVYAHTPEEAVEKVTQHLGIGVEVGAVKEMLSSPNITWIGNDKA